MDEINKAIAILIDAENVSPKYIKAILDEVSMIGTPAYKRIYGDWTAQDMSGWKKVLLEYNLTPMQQFSYTQGKNASDSAMIIDAMDILYAKNVDGFCLVSSDSDFTRLASRLRESRMFVVGMGESKTPTAFKSACNTFKYLDIIMGAAPKQTGKKHPEKAEKPEPTNSAVAPFTEIVSKISEILDKDSDDDGFLPLSQVGIMLSRLYADFDSRNYGYSKLLKLIDASGAFETSFEPTPGGGKNPIIRNKQQA